MASRDLRRIHDSPRLAHRGDPAGAWRSLARRAALLHLSDLRDEDDVLCAVCLRLQSALGLHRAAVIRPCGLFRRCRLFHGPCRQGLGGRTRNRHPDRRRRCSAARPCDRLLRHPPAGDLFRDDHAGAVADVLLLLRPGGFHGRRGRHPGRAARLLPRPARPAGPVRDVLLRHGQFSARPFLCLADRKFPLRHDSPIHTRK